MKKFLLVPVLASLMAFSFIAAAQNPCDLSISGFVTDISPNGTGGSIAVEVGGCDSVTSYIWYYNGVEIESFAPLGPEIDAIMGAGNYCVMAYCGNDCVENWCVTVTDSEGCTVTICEEDSSGCDLEAVVTENGWNDLCAEAAGGTPPYAYSWSNGANTVCVDYYENWCVWVTDAEGCLVEMCEETSANDCELSNLEWTFNYDNDGNIECDGEFFEVTIDFDYENVNTAGFDLSYNGVFYSFNSYNDLPLTISLPAENSWGWLQICDNDNSDCCLSFDFVAPCYEENSDCIDDSQIDETQGCFTNYDPVCGCDGVTYGNECEAYYWYGVTSWTEGECEQNNDCEIWDVFAEAWECDSLGYFYVDITFQSNNTAEQFQIVGNGMNYGTFSYGSPYYTIGPIASNNSSMYEFVIQDLEDSNCSAYTELMVDCSGSTGMECEADFSWSTQWGGTTVVFENTSEPAFLPMIYSAQYIWDFGDGSTETNYGGATDYTYANDGVYEVCLTMWVTDLYTGEVVCENEYCEEVIVGSEEFDCEAYFEAYNDTVAGAVNPLMFGFADMSAPADAIVSWQWDMGGLGTYVFGDATSQYAIYQYFLEGAYEACLTIVAVDDDEECVSTYCTTISTEMVSVEEENWLTETKLYPNPTTGNVVLELLTADSDKIQIRLLNALGQLVLQQSVSEGATQRRLLLLTEQLPSGVYTVQVENAAGESTFIRLTKAE